MPPKPRRRTSAEESSAIIQALEESQGDMAKAFKHPLVKPLKMTERQIESHVKYMRTKKNKKVNEASGPNGKLWVFNTPANTDQETLTGDRSLIP